MIGKIRLMVAIEDEVYLDRVCDYLETGHGRFITERFCDSAAFSAALKAGRPCDAILFEPEMAIDVALEGTEGIKIHFGEKDIPEAENGCYSIREYQRTEAIASAVLTICSRDKRFTGVDPDAAGRACFYVFTSPAGGMGVTTAALAAALHLAQAGRKTLYITLEQQPTIGGLLPACSLTMTQLMRMVIEKNPKLLTMLEGGKSTEPHTALEYLEGFSDPTDFDALLPEHTRELSSRLCALGRYDTIIADVPWNTRQGFALWEGAGKIFLVSHAGRLPVSRVNAFLQYAAEKELPSRHRLHLLLNEASADGGAGLPVTPAACLPHCPALAAGADFASCVLQSGAFSDAVSELVRQL